MDKNKILKINSGSLSTHLSIIGLFLVIVFVYCSPLLQGKRISQHDMVSVEGMKKEIVDFEKETGREILWTNSMFGGMPSYLISCTYPSNLTGYLFLLFNKILPNPSSLIFLYLIGFYILLISLKIDPWLSFAGAIAFAFSSYNFIIIDAGHISKARAIAFMPPVIGGILMIFRRKYLAGGVITALFLALEIRSNHMQIAYYLFLALAIFGLIRLVIAFRNKNWVPFFKSAGITVMAGVVALLPNVSILWTVYEYSNDTIRGKSELISKQGEGGLDKDYALSWSYGISETMTLLIPGFNGGSSTGKLDKSSETYNLLKTKGLPENQAEGFVSQLPLYWGPQPFTSGPVYFGAAICFLFVLALFILKGPLLIWVLIVTAISIMLAWGKHFTPLTDIFFYHFPFYNKFRSVSMILVIPSILMPLAAILTIWKIASKKVITPEVIKKVKYAAGITAGLALFFSLFSSAFFDFTSPEDGDFLSQLKQMTGDDAFASQILNSLVADRESMLRSDGLRSVMFILIAAALTWMLAYEKLNLRKFSLLLTVLILIDMWPVNKRYLNNDDYVTKKEFMRPFQPTQADLQILEDKDPNYRVLNLSVNTFNDAITSYHHKSVGGYHAAKLGRYQDLISNQISKNNMDVLNMLNTRYVIVKGQQGPQVQRNPGSLGNAWFVKGIEWAADADGELNGLTDLNTADSVIIDKRFEPYIGSFIPKFDSTSGIKLLSYFPDHLTYESNSSTDQLAVFSEIYYNDKKGWKAYIDGKYVPHIRCNYVLRAMILPQGTHKVEFKFEPQTYITGERISLAGSLLLIAGLGFLGWRRNKGTGVENEDEVII